MVQFRENRILFHSWSFELERAMPMDKREPDQLSSTSESNESQCILWSCKWSVCLCKSEEGFVRRRRAFSRQWRHSKMEIRRGRSSFIERKARKITFSSNSSSEAALEHLRPAIRLVQGMSKLFGSLYNYIFSFYRIFVLYYRGTIMYRFRITKSPMRSVI